MLSNLSNEKKAYFVGYMCGDGAYVNGNRLRTDRMAVTSVDLDVVRWISKNIIDFPETNPKLSDNKEAGIFAKQVSYSKVFPVDYTPFFKLHGLLCKKEDRLFQNIAKQDMKHFWLGILDSDGSISFTKRKDRDRICAKVSITHPSLKLLEKLQNYLRDELDIASSIKPKGTEKCFIFCFNKLEDIDKFCSWVYSREESVVLQRKYFKWLELKGEILTSQKFGQALPPEFKKLPEYLCLIGSTSKYMLSVNGVEYPSAYLASKSVGEDISTVQRRCLQRNMGYSKRPKTTREKEDYTSFVNRQINKLFEDWKEKQ